MSQGQNPYSTPSAEAVYSSSAAAAYAGDVERTAFIRRTYAHLFAAIGAFVGLELIYFNLIPAETLMGLIGLPFIIAMIVGFIVVSMIANAWAAKTASPGAQYFALGAYVLFDSLLFIPMLAICVHILPDGISVLKSAAFMTAIVFGGLTSIVFTTKSDFSGLGKYLFLAMIAALAVVLGGFLFGFHLGLWFSGLMIVVMSGYILYDTSNILHHYRTDQHVAASLALFASVTTLFWYILRFAMEMSGE